MTSLDAPLLPSKNTDQVKSHDANHREEKGARGRMKTTESKETTLREQKRFAESVMILE